MIAVKRLAVTLIGLFLIAVPQVRAQNVGTTNSGGTTGFVDPMSLKEVMLICGDKTTQGTPIAGNACGADAVCGNADDGTSGTITIAGIPGTATVTKATLYWTVLTNSDEASNRGQNISFDGNAISGTKVGFSAGRTPCFPQANTFAWKKDVTSLVSSPGNGTYTLTGFPGGNQIAGDDFAEGVSLHIVFSDPSLSAKQIVVFEGLAVTVDVGDTVSQSLTGFKANASGPVTATWFPVIGNGQQAAETISFDGSAGSIDFSNDLLLDGGTSEIPANGCTYTDSGQMDCFWDDDKPDVSAAIGNGDTTAAVNYTLTGDCHTFVSMQLVVSTDAAGVCLEGGAVVDAACPPGAPYKNHGAYVSCVAHAAEAFLASLGCFSDAEREEIQSCIVNPRARSDVGKEPHGHNRRRRR